MIGRSGRNGSAWKILAWCAARASMSTTCACPARWRSSSSAATTPTRNINSVDLSAAQAAPGVVAVWDGEHVKDVARMTNSIPIEGRKISPLPPLAHGKVTHAGYAVAAVAAESKYQARDAAALVDIDYEPAARRHEARGGDGAGRARALAGVRHQRRLPLREGGRRRRRRLRQAPSTPSRCGWSTAGWRRSRWSRAASWPATTARTTS